MAVRDNTMNCDTDLENSVYVNEKLKLNTDNDEEDGNEGRGTWDKKLDFILSLIGYSVGVSNLWRFPYLCVRNGGGAFLIPFFFFLFMAGIPLFFLEVSLGQFTGISCLFVWEFCPLFRGLGYLMVTISGIASFYYICVIAWVIFYLGNSFFPVLPWASCNNPWNTKSCITPNEQLNSSRTAMLNVTSSNNQSSAEEFWSFRVLNYSTGLDDLDGVQWHMVLSLFAAWLLVFFCLCKGIKTLGKVVYVTALMPYLLLTIFLIRGLTLPGAVNGIIFYLKPEFEKLWNFQVWIEAGVQVFFSLGPAWGGLITMASYNKFHNNCLRDSLIGALADGLTSFYGGFVIFSVLGFMAHEADVDISAFSTSGPGLAFVVYPQAIAKLPLPQLWAVLFFLTLILLGLDSEFAMFESVSSAIVDAFPRKLKKWKTAVTGVLSLVFCLLGLLFATRGGIYIFTLIDWYCSACAVMLCSFIECIIIGWVYGAKRFSGDIQLMLGRPPPTILRICWCIVTPAIMLVTLIVTLYMYPLPSFKSYVYPGWARGIGLVIAFTSVVPIPVCMVIALLQAKGSLTQRLWTTLNPSPKWGPWLRKYSTKYLEYNVKSEGDTWWARAVDNMIGQPKQM